jgi:hypothetical protein
MFTLLTLLTLRILSLAHTAHNILPAHNTHPAHLAQLTLLSLVILLNAPPTQPPGQLILFTLLTFPSLMTKVMLQFDAVYAMYAHCKKLLSSFASVNS